MFCRKCGKEVTGKETFCPGCGAKLDIPLKPAKAPAAARSGRDAELILKAAITLLGLLMALSTVLPYLEIFGKSVSLLWTDGSQLGDGVCYIILAAVCILCAWIDQRLVTLLGSIGSVIMLIYEKHKLNELQDQYGDLIKLVSKGSGYHLVTFSSILLLIVSIGLYVYGNRNKKKETLN